MALLSAKQLKQEKSDYEKAALMVSCLINNQTDKNVDENWVLENFNWEKVLYIGMRISEEIIDSMDIINTGSSSNSSGSGKKK